MKLPSGSSLILASLAVSASSSSSLSALAAPAGDLTSDSSSPDPVAHCRDGAVTRSLDDPQSRGLSEFIEPIEKDLKGMLSGLEGLLFRRDSGSAADKDSTSPGSTTPSPSPPAPPSTPAVLPVRPPTSPDPPAKD